jgi:hypothetical protein
VWTGPHIKDEPPASGTRHQVLRGFEETDLLPFGGSLTALRVDATALVPLTFVPPFPTYPPETSWMRQPTSDIPGLVLSEHGASRVAYLPADIDRRYAREHLPDHARLIANIVRWVANETVPLAVEAPASSTAISTSSPAAPSSTSSTSRARRRGAPRSTSSFVSDRSR